ncbi:hypothetical protein THAOC_27578, partial [Thalassiosira oceanica]
RGGLRNLSPACSTISQMSQLPALAVNGVTSSRRYPMTTRRSALELRDMEEDAGCQETGSGDPPAVLPCSDQHEEDNSRTA